MSALAQIDDDQLVSQPDKGTIFLSRRDELRLTKTPRYPIMGPAGQKVGEQPGETLAFRKARLFVPADGKIALEDGREVDAAPVREWLLNHRLLGDVNEGFWAVETKAPPISAAEQEMLANAGVNHDVEKIEAMIVQERAGWAREDFIEVMTGTIGQIEMVQARTRAEIEAEQATAAGKAAKK